MGLADKMAERGTRIIQERLRKEYERAGSTARAEMETISLEKGQAGKALKDIAVGLGGGHITPEALWVLRLQHQGFLHWYIQPFTKIALLPGEHHAILPGGVSATAGLEHGTGLFSKPQWWSDDKHLAAVLNNDAALGKICKKVKWRWQIPGGARLEYTAPLELRNLGKARAHVALKSGNYGGDRVGFQVFVALCQGLKRHLTAQKTSPESLFRTAYRYSHIVLSELEV